MIVRNDTKVARWPIPPSGSGIDPCARNAIRRKTRKRNEPKPVSVRCLGYVLTDIADHPINVPRASARLTRKAAAYWLAGEIALAQRASTAKLRGKNFRS